MTSIPHLVHVALGERSYDIAIAEGSLKNAGVLTRAALGAKTHKLALISNPRVHTQYGKTVEKSLKQADFTTLTHLMGDGERAKSLKTAERAWSFLIANRFERGDVIVALGGGVVGDMAGFVAACFQRGINFVQIPTTLLAQIDSSVGGKTAINHPLGKNLIGAFHQPKTVIIDPSVLRTLPPRELSAGMYEALKYGVIWDRALFDFIRDNQANVEQFDAATLAHIIRRSCEIKAEVVTSDERESGLRKILNYGHTIGHALEAVTQYRRLKHGEAVGYGMQAAASIATKAGLLAAEELHTITTGIAALGRLPRISDLQVPDITAAMKLDKKAAQGKVPLILPTRIGTVVIKDDIAPAMIRASIKEVLAA